MSDSGAGAETTEKAAPDARPPEARLRWWTLLLASRPGLSPLRLSLALGLSLAVAYVASEAALGRFARIAADEHTLGDFRFGFSLIAVLAYLPGALAHAALSAERTSRELGISGALAAISRAALRVVGLAGAAVFLAIPLFTNPEESAWDLRLLPPEALWHRAMLAPTGWLLARFSAFVWAESRRLARHGAAARVDLLDLTSLAPYARSGLRHALLAAGLFSFLLFALVDQRVAPRLPVVLTMLGAVNVFGALGALLAPMWGAHRAIGAAKARELARCDDDLRFLRKQAAPVAGTLADVAAWRARVDAVSDWPLDAPTLRRFLLYLALPLGSWLGGALVDLVVERLVGSS